MGKKWVREEIKKNAVADAGGKSVHWLLANHRAVLGAAGAAGAVLLIAGLSVHKRLRSRDAAWEKLAIAQSYAYQGQDGPALEQIKSMELDFGGAPAVSYGLLFAGDVLYREGKYREAQEAYQKVLDRGSPKSALPYALGDLGVSQEAAGSFKEAADTDQRFLDSYQDHFLAPQVHASLARCLDAMGERDKAKATYERISLLYPDTYWAQWAQARLKS